jgi:hypothetical protein
MNLYRAIHISQQSLAKFGVWCLQVMTQSRCECRYSQFSDSRTLVKGVGETVRYSLYLSSDSGRIRCRRCPQTASFKKAAQAHIGVGHFVGFVKIGANKISFMHVPWKLVIFRKNKPPTWSFYSAPRITPFVILFHCRRILTLTTKQVRKRSAFSPLTWQT